MKIALVGGRDMQQFPTLAYGGIETCVENLAWGLYRNGYDFVCIVPARDRATISEEYPFRIVESPVPPISGPEENVWPFANSLPGIIRDIDPDVIWSQDFWSAETLQHLGIPIICTFHCFTVDEGTNRRWFRRRENTWYRFLSGFQMNMWVDFSESWHHERCFQIYSGLADEEYDFGDESERDDYFLWVAGLGWGPVAKGLQTFLDLAVMNPGKRFVAYGTGNPPLEKQLHEISGRLPNFEFRGALPRGAVHRETFRRAKTLIMPTKTPEPLGRTNLEAISKGTPVLGSRCGALPELIEDDVTGFLTDDIHVMSERLDAVFDNRRIFEISKRFHVDNEIRELVRWSERILSG